MDLLLEIDERYRVYCLCPLVGCPRRVPLLRSLQSVPALQRFVRTDSPSAGLEQLSPAILCLCDRLGACYTCWCGQNLGAISQMWARTAVKISDLVRDRGDLHEPVIWFW